MRPSICEVCLGVIVPLAQDHWVHSNLVLDDHIATPFIFAGSPLGYDAELNRQFNAAMDAIEKMEKKDDEPE